MSENVCEDPTFFTEHGLIGFKYGHENNCQKWNMLLTSAWRVYTKLKKVQERSKDTFRNNCGGRTIQKDEWRHVAWTHNVAYLAENSSLLDDFGDLGRTLGAETEHGQRRLFHGGLALVSEALDGTTDWRCLWTQWHCRRVHLETVTTTHWNTSSTCLVCRHHRYTTVCYTYTYVALTVLVN